MATITSIANLGKYKTRAAAPASTGSIYAPGSTAGIYPTAQTKYLMPKVTTKKIPAHYKEIRISGGQGYAGGPGQMLQKFIPDQTITEQESPEAYTQRLLQQAQDLQNQYIATNEQRYSDILGGYRDRYGTGMEMVNGLGDSQRTEIDRVFKANQGKMLAGLVQRGLGNSSMLYSGGLGVQRERLRARGELEDRLLRQKLLTHGALSGDTLGFMERRTDAPPDVSGLLQMAQNYGQYASPQSGPYMAGIQFAGAGPFMLPQFGLGGGGMQYGQGQTVPGYQGPTAAQMASKKALAVQQRYRGRKAYGVDASPYSLQYASGLV